MSVEIKDLEPRLLFKHFDALVKIPRGSKYEDAAREYVLAFARAKGLDSRVDAVGNVVIVVPATPGHESAPIVVIQGHLDIVWEKHSHIDIDFMKDPIPAWVDGDVIRTRGTTLGADNGIGLAAGLAIAEDSTAVHGPLEILCTVDEETGMGGAFNLDPGIVRGRIMLNLDSEDEGTIFVGCAGGGDTTLRVPITRIPVPAAHKCVKFRVAGLKGGHSGLDIVRNRGNAIKVLARAIEAAIPLDGALLCCMTAGSKRNAIPREAEACMWVPEAKVASLPKAVSDFQAKIRIELGASDPGVEIFVEDPTCDTQPVRESPALLRLILAAPHGPIAMSQDIVGLVETSTNFAIAGIEGDFFTALCNSRSSISSAMNSVRLTLKSVVELAGGEAILAGEYPGWRPNLDSQVLKVLRSVWKDRTGNVPNVTAIHAGLECGVIGERCPGMDMVSFGPDIRGAHSPDEHVFVSSTGRFYDYLKDILAHLG